MPERNEKFIEDPTLIHARREFRVALCVVVAVIGWTITVCATDGFAGAGGSPVLLFGLPRWAVLGILLPWAFMLGMNYWFGLWFVAEDDLSRDDLAEGESLPGTDSNAVKDIQP